MQGWGRQGELTPSKGPWRMGIRHHDQGIAFPRKGFYLFIHNMHPWCCYNMYLFVLDKEEAVCAGYKKNHPPEIQYNGLHGSERRWAIDRRSCIMNMHGSPPGSMSDVGGYSIHIPNGK